MVTASLERRRKAPAGKRGYVELLLSEVSEDPNNEFRHPEAQIERLMRSLTRFGQQRAIIIDQRNVVVAGEGVLTAARRLGWQTIRCKYSQLTGHRRAGYRQLDNMSQRLARLDEYVMAANLGRLVEAGAAGDVLALGLDDESFARALDPGAWRGRVLDLDGIGAYDPNAETFVIKVAGVPRGEAEGLLLSVNNALEGTGYEAAA
jgi:hypothetical protein